MMPRGRSGVPHAEIRSFVADNPGVTVIALAAHFKTTRAAMSRRMTDLFAAGEVVKRPYEPCKPVGWVISGNRLP